MARYKPSPELMEIYKEDLPDDIENIIDDVAGKATNIVDDMIDSYETELKSKTDIYKSEVIGIFEEFDKEVSRLIRETETNIDSMTLKLDVLKTSTEALSTAVDAQSPLNLDVSKINEATRELTSAIVAQREKIKTLGTNIGKYSGALVRVAIPF